MRCAWIIAAVATLTLGAACNNEDSLDCSSNISCPTGHVCEGSRCRKLCTTDADCAAGTYCAGTICVQGTQQRPILETITGLSSATCAQADCLGTGFAISGAHLGGAMYTLTKQGGGPTYAMVAAGTIRDDYVEIEPVIPDPNLFEAGLYTLQAVNQGGSAEAGINLLQGDPGPAGPTGPSGPAGGGAAAELYYDTSAFGADTYTISHNRMIVRLTGDYANNSVSPTSMPIDQTRLVEMCQSHYVGDARAGCKISLGVTHWKETVDATSGDSYMVAGAITGTPCRLVFPGSDLSSWGMSECYAYSHWSSVGVDGRSTIMASGTSYTDNSIMLGFRNLCFLTESPPDPSTPGTLLDDDAEGLYLVASGTDWDIPGTGAGDMPFPSTDNLTRDQYWSCILIIDE